MIRKSCFFILFGLVLMNVGADGGCDDNHPDSTETYTRTDRYADFTHVTTTSMVNHWNQGSWTKNKQAVNVTITPNRAGAYYVESFNQNGILKFSISEGQLLESHLPPTTDPTTQPISTALDKTITWNNISEFLVTWSDGKDIERTVVHTDP